MDPGGRPPPKLRIEGLTKDFRTRAGLVRALEDVSLSVEENEFVTLVGPSGCGKSTLLAIVAGLEEPTAGTVQVDGVEVTGPGRDRGLVFQAYTLFPWLSVRENVAFALHGEALSRREVAERVDEHLAIVGLEAFADAYPRELSGGMKQRVAIARALVYRPKVLLMDEPFGALDAQTRAAMQELLVSVWERHRITVLFVTHDVDEAVLISDRVYVMSPRPGRIVQVVDVTLDRPRSYDMEVSPDFVAIKAKVLGLIRGRQ